VAADLAREARTIGTPDRITVFILTFCRKPELLYGSTLIFKTLRVGFPTAAVVVVDNASVPEARRQIKSLATENGCRFLQIEAAGVEHHEFLSAAVQAMAGEAAPQGPTVFLDPDVCLWSNCEGFSIDGLIAGKFMPPFTLPGTGTLMMPRLHTSFLWIPDTGRLWARIAAIKAEHFDFGPFRSHTTKIGGQWCRYDTGANLYAAMREQASHFTEGHLACYDHLLGGCHLDWIYRMLEPEGREAIRELHARAKAGRLDDLRGLWDRHKAIWYSRMTHSSVLARRSQV